jgi:molybdopterin converting factor small subunit
MAELARCTSFELPFLEGESLAALKQRITVKYTDLSAALDDCRLAINERFAEPDEQLKAGDIVALIPPVAGG